MTKDNKEFNTIKSMSKRTIPMTEKKHITTAYSVGVCMIQEGVQPMERAVHSV